MSKAKKEAKKLARKQKKQLSQKAIMKKAKDKSNVSTKVKKKHWYLIIAPKSFNEMVLGKSLVTEANLLVGRTVKANLMNITGDMKKQSSLITFKISNIIDNKAVTRIQQYELMPAAVKRLVRRNQDKIEWSFVVKTKDNIDIRVKPLILTIFKSKKSARTAIIKKAEKLLTEYFNKNNFVNIVKDVISFRVQGITKKQLSKIFPVRICEIRFLGKVVDKNNRSEEIEEIEEVNEKPKIRKEIKEEVSENKEEDE